MFTSIVMITITIFIIIIINITIMIMVIAADLKYWLLSCYKLQTTSHASVLSRLLRIVLMVIVVMMMMTHLLRTVSTQAQNPVQVKLNPLWRKRLKSEGKGFKFLFNFLGNFSKQSQRWNICLQSRIQGMRVISGYFLLHISSSKGTGMQQRPNYETSEVKEAPR